MGSGSRICEFIVIQADSYIYTPDRASGPSGSSSYSYNDDDLVSSETDAADTQLLVTPSSFR
jgi:hypothetical protein